jgi:tripartite-type tricarboxylate transporter receptor subunit TctC
LIAFRAGGGADTQARLIAETREERHAWQFIPEQVTGKGGLNMAAQLRDAPADGTVIGMAVTETFGYNMAAANTPMSPEDYVGLSTTAGFQMGIVSRADSGWSSFPDVVEAAKGGEAIRFGVMSPKLADLAYLLGDAQGVEFNIVQLPGGKAVLDAINAGDVDVGFVAGIQGKGVATGDLVNLASGLSEPLAQTPDAPTLADLGVPFNADGYFVFVGPAGMPENPRAALSEAIAAVASDPDSKAGGMIANAFGAPVTITGDELDSMLAQDYEAAGELLEAASL